MPDEYAAPVDQKPQLLVNEFQRRQRVRGERRVQISNCHAECQSDGDADSKNTHI